MTEDEDATALVKRRFPKSVAWTAIIAPITVAVAVVAAQNLTSTDQEANNWINGLSALIAAFNVVFTFWLLRTAQRQLDTLRQDLESQQGRHDKELAQSENLRAVDAEQSRLNMENMRQLLSTQTAALALARNDAREAQYETARARYDASAPRCVIKIGEVSVEMRDNPLAEGWTWIGEPTVPYTDLDVRTVKVVLTFHVRNWGDEPITFSIGGGVIDQSGPGFVDPQQRGKFTITLSRTLRTWKDVAVAAQGGAQTSSIKSDVEFTVPVESIGHGVIDNHWWHSYVIPVELHEFGVSVKSPTQIIETLRIAAFPRRTYPHLEKLIRAEKDETERAVLPPQGQSPGVEDGNILP